MKPYRSTVYNRRVFCENMSIILFSFLDTVYDFLHIFSYLALLNKTYLAFYFFLHKDYFHCKQEFDVICLNCLIIEILVLLSRPVEILSNLYKLFVFWIVILNCWHISCIIVRQLRFICSALIAVDADKSKEKRRM